MVTGSLDQIIRVYDVNNSFELLYELKEAKNYVLFDYLDILLLF